MTTSRPEWVWELHFVEADARGAVNAKQLRQEVSGSGAFPTIPWISPGASGMGSRSRPEVSTSTPRSTTSMAPSPNITANFQWRWQRNPHSRRGPAIPSCGRHSILIGADFPGLLPLECPGPGGFFKFSFYAVQTNPPNTSVWDDVFAPGTERPDQPGGRRHRVFHSSKYSARA